MIPFYILLYIMADWTEDISELQLEIPLLRKSHMSHAAKSWGAQAHKPPFFGDWKTRLLNRWSADSVQLPCQTTTRGLSRGWRGSAAGTRGTTHDSCVQPTLMPTWQRTKLFQKKSRLLSSNIPSRPSFKWNYSKRSGLLLENWKKSQSLSPTPPNPQTDTNIA